MSASSQCHHPDLHFTLHTTHMGDANVKTLEISAFCKVCDSPMVFLGDQPFGASMAFPTRSIDWRVMCLPMVGMSEEPDTTLSLVGRVVREQA